ncbi:MAG TPA: TolC family protein [Gemmatimonadetes bacterium]|nr:TolC family protein [Gemmatimonadota bacterium]
MDEHLSMQRRSMQTRSRVIPMADWQDGRVKKVLTMTSGALLLTAAMALGQEAERLTLDEAIDLARENNPTFLQTQNNEAQADWGVRQATSNLFVPSVTAFGQARYRSPGVDRIGTITTGGVGQGALYQSFYQLSATYTLNGNTLFGLSSAKAEQNAARAFTEVAEFAMESAVTFQYMTTLRARDQVTVARSQVERSITNLEIAQARVDAQAAIVTDARQAQVQVGRDSVALLRAESAQRVGTLGLLETVGLNLGTEVELVSQFEVFRPTWTSRELISIALESHPGLNAAVANEGARRANLRQVRGQYFPNLSVTGSVDGFTQQIQNGSFNVQAAEAGIGRALENCNTFNDISAGLSLPLAGFPQDCTGLALSTGDRQGILDANSSFPFNFTNQPFSLALNVRIPIFDGFSRERQVSQAANALEDAEYSLRAEELRLRTAVTAAYDALTTAYEVEQVEERNRGVATEQLELSQQRYTLGADNFLVLLDAERTMADGERAYLDSIYAFHIELANLENAVGQRLRPEG